MRRRKQQIRRLSRVVLCLSLSALLAADPQLLEHHMAYGQLAEAEEAARAPTPEELEELAQKMERLFDALEEAQKEIPRDTFDAAVILHGQPEAGLEGVGTEVEKLFEWVRDNTYFVPYAGVLRGHKGTLMDRLGNSFDRSLLLGELLRLAGHEARLVIGTLAPPRGGGAFRPRSPHPGGRRPAGAGGKGVS